MARDSYKINLTMISGVIAGIFLALNFSFAGTCLEDTLKFIETTKNTNKEALIRSAYYNDRILKEFSAFPSSVWDQEIEKTIDDFAAYDQAFDSKEFKKWLSDHPSEKKPNTTLGDYLAERQKQFAKLHPSSPSQQLSQAAKELPETLSDVSKTCGSNVTCQESRLGGWLSRKLKNSCISGNRASAMRNMVTSLALTNASYAMTYAHHPEDGFPWTLMATNLFWTPIMAEMGCRNTLSEGKSTLGKKIDFGQPLERREKLIHMGKSYVNYMKISPLYSASYLAINVSGQLISGKKNLSDIDMQDLSQQFVSMTLYDAVYAVPRIILVTDPLYMKGFPKLRQGIANHTRRAVFTEAIYTPIDWGTRIAIGSVNTEIFMWWQKQQDQLFGPKKQPTK
jgi:hypothetical protein